MGTRTPSEIRFDKPINYCTACGRTTRLKRLDESGEHYLCEHCGAVLCRTTMSNRTYDPPANRPAEK